MTTKPCAWRCGDDAPDHKHFTVIVRDAKTGKLLGRLCPDGTATNRNVYAAVLSRAAAERIASAINAESNFTAVVRPF